MTSPATQAHRSPSKRSLFLKITERLSLLLFGLILSEILLRTLGNTTWGASNNAVDLRSIITQADPDLGWRTKPGAFSFDNGSLVTILPNGDRAVGNGEPTDGPPVILIGDSSIFGYGVSDSETVGWFLQQLYPSLRIRNRAVPGYGLLQIYLSLRELLSTGPAQVIVGFADWDGDRSIGSPYWAEALAQRTSTKNILLPYADLNEKGTLEIFPAKPFFPEWPFRNLLAITYLGERVYVRLSAYSRLNHRDEITDRLLLQLRELLNHSASRWTVFLYQGGIEKYKVATLLQQGQIPTLRCVHPHFNEPGYVAVNDNHPNGKVQHFWADCLQGFLTESS